MPIVLGIQASDLNSESSSAGRIVRHTQEIVEKYETVKKSKTHGAKNERFRFEAQTALNLRRRRRSLDFTPCERPPISLNSNSFHHLRFVHKIAVEHITSDSQSKTPS